MGNPVSKLCKTIAEGKWRKDVIDQRLQTFHVLEKMVTSHLEAAKKTILAGTKSDQELHGGTVVDIQQQVNIIDSKSPSQKINHAITDFFRGDLISGLLDIVEVGTNGIFGNTVAGQYEQKDMFIVWTDYALILCDVYYYRWNFVSRGVVEEVDGVLGVLLVKRVIDLEKTKDDLIAYVVSKTAKRLEQKKSKQADPRKLLEQALKVLSKVRAVQEQLKSTQQ